MKASIIRDRNFNTPYYSNPYGYNNKKGSGRISERPSSSRTKMRSSRAFNDNTKSILTPFVIDKAEKVDPKTNKIPINNDILMRSQSIREKNKFRENYARMKSTLVPRPSMSPKKFKDHNNSFDGGKSMASTLNSTFTTGFSSSMRSSDAFQNSLPKSFHNRNLGDNSSLARRYAKFKLKQNVPMYTFNGNDSPLLGNKAYKSTIHGNESAYQKIYDSARPVAHTNNRKYCSMTRFIKDLQDNRIFNRGKMSVYRGGFR